MENKKYILVAFPYPSGSGLHMGHAFNYGIIDSYCRYQRFIGNEVFQPIGYDSFGLPTENYAKSVGRSPKDVTIENINRFRNQMVKMDTQYEEKLITSDESYQKWTKWLFTKLVEHGLAYKAFGEVNYCPSCETTLAREQVVECSFGINICERCRSVVEKKNLNQWYFKITAYKERLIKNLDIIDYPKSTINAQRAWLENLHDWCVSRQRSWGCPIPIEDETDTLDTFVDSSFYFIRYCDADNENELCSKEKYMQPDLYVIGQEHNTSHLTFARFINMFLFDIGVVPNEEPFKKVINQGMILNNGEKMSKSKGNVVNPDDYDSDVLRFYLSFLGHYFDGGSWNDNNISGIKRFINRFKEWMNKPDGTETVDIEKFKKTVFDYTESFKFNKVVSSFMIMVNENRTKNITAECKKELINVLEIYMPSIKNKINEKVN